MNKVVRDGKVAILIHGSYGAGWSTWADIEHRYAMIFCPQMVAALEAVGPKGDCQDTLVAIAEKLWPDCYTGGVPNEIVWLPEGTLFRITEYDGLESVETFETTDYIKA